MTSDYAADRARSFWGMAYELPEQRQARIQAARNARYATPASRSLEEYASAPRPSKTDRRQGETTDAWRRRIDSQYARHIAEEELVAIYQAIAAAEAAEAAPSHDKVRGELAARTQGQGIGVMGAMSAEDRNSAVYDNIPRAGRAASDYSAAGRTPGQRVPMSTAEAMAIVRQRDQEARGGQPMRQDASQLRSTGAGFMGVDR
jgi:hypothetical protein